MVLVEVPATAAPLGSWLRSPPPSVALAPSDSSSPRGPVEYSGEKKEGSGITGDMGPTEDRSDRDDLREREVGVAAAEAPGEE